MKKVLEALQNDKSTPLPLHLAIQRTKATAAAEVETLPSKKHFQFFYLLYTVSVANTHTRPRATPCLSSSGAILSNVLPPLIEWVHLNQV